MYTYKILLLLTLNIHKNHNGSLVWTNVAWVKARSVDDTFIYTWRRHQMETFSALLGLSEFTGHRWIPLTIFSPHVCTVDRITAKNTVSLLYFILNARVQFLRHAGAHMASPNYYPNECWAIVSWSLWKNIRLYCYHNTVIRTQENALL